MNRLSDDSQQGRPVPEIELSRPQPIAAICCRDWPLVMRSASHRCGYLYWLRCSPRANRHKGKLGLPKRLMRWPAITPWEDRGVEGGKKGRSVYLQQKQLDTKSRWRRSTRNVLFYINRSSRSHQTNSLK